MHLGEEVSLFIIKFHAQALISSGACSTRPILLSLVNGHHYSPKIDGPIKFIPASGGIPRLVGNNRPAECHIVSSLIALQYCMTALVSQDVR